MTPPILVHETSSARVDDHALVLPAGQTVGQLRSRLRAEQRAAWDLACVVDPGGRLLATLTAADLLLLPDEAVLGPLQGQPPRAVPAGMDQESMASWALHHGLSSVPVVDAQDRLVGVVGAVTLMEVLRREHVEDLHRLAGISRESAEARQALEAPPLRRVRHRLPWLLVGLAGSMVATFIMSRFEGQLAAVPAVAFFVPGLVYLADAIGTQSEAVAVRGLSLSEAPLGHLLAGEMRTGLLIGLLLALAIAPAAWLAYGHLRLALAVGLAVAAAGGVASLLGLLLPWTLQRAGQDPAYGSGPLATIMQDVLSLLIYFGIVTALVT